MKPLTWLGDSLHSVREFSDVARRQAGFELSELQKGLEPSDWKPLNSVGIGVKEIRIHAENEYRVIYVAKFAEAIYVLHAFTKKTRQTAKPDIKTATRRYQDLQQYRRQL